jgi:hypothetical protein
MHCPPKNEMGVVHLFGDYARKHKLKLVEIRAAFPDALVSRTSAGREELIRVEFEFRSSHFRAHRHDAKRCDWIVCWEHDWPDHPRHLKVIELRSYYGLGWQPWFGSESLGCDYGFNPKSFGRQKAFKDIEVPRRAKVGDLVLCTFGASLSSSERCGLNPDEWCAPKSSDPEIYPMRWRTWLLGIAKIGAINSSGIRRTGQGDVISADARKLHGFSPRLPMEDVFDHSSIRGYKNLAGVWPEVVRRIIHLRPDAKGLEKYL